MMGIETSRWDAADHLAGTEAIVAYLEAVFEEGDAALIAAALNDVARAKGLGDAALNGATDLASVIRTLKALGLELTAKAA
jgi:DNA-binding phage protein